MLKINISYFFRIILFPSKNKKYFFTFLSIRESKRREKFYLGPFAKVYACEMQKFREFLSSRNFLLLK